MPIFAPFSYLEQRIVEGLDPAAQAFLDATGITDPTIESAIDTLVTDLKDAGIWTKIDALYPMVGGDATKHSYNLKDTSQYQITFGGGITHNVSGSQGNGSTGYADTNLNASTELAGGDSENGCHMFMYTQNVVAEGGLDCGLTDNVNSWHLNARNPSNVFNTRNISSTLDSQSGMTNTSGVFSMSRTSSTSYFKSVNKTHQTVSRTAATMPNGDIAFMCQRGTTTWRDYQTRMFSLVSLGSSLSQAEVDDFVDINQTFQTTLNRFA